MLTSVFLLQQSSGFTWIEMKPKADSLCFLVAVEDAKSIVCMGQNRYGIGMIHRKRN